ASHSGGAGRPPASPAESSRQRRRHPERAETQPNWRTSTACCRRSARPAPAQPVAVSGGLQACYAPAIPAAGGQLRLADRDFP
ncbi:hypothetical protein G9O61_00g022820, partial [Vairimorpha ceranae]